ncbi:LrgB-like family [Geosmithia morbida]|uniref:LrgB-like family n=1 Tax=Geosmithia morbida TaxID=1094350 RepID=A0A9P4Z2B0_9HYPO|nr:LrgB-like family [Geosmithia morbida]KAF4126131.1 LrgB-like family [Geosmithia morbida]
MSSPSVRSAEQNRSMAGDVFIALKLALISSGPKLLRNWILVPAGLLLMLLACFGVDALFRLIGTSFPPSVACLVLLLVALLLAESVLGNHRVKKIVAVIDVPAGWSLQWMGIFFTPSFILLPLSDPVGVAEVFKIIAVFVIGFIITFAAVAYLVRGLQPVLGSSKRAQVQRAEELDRQVQEQIPLTQANPGHGTPTPEASPLGPSTPAEITPAETTPAPSRPQTPPQLRIQHRHHNSGDPPPTASRSLVPPAYPSQDPVPPSRPERWAVLIASHLDTGIFALILLVAGIPVFYATGYAMPLHLAVNVLSYMAASTVVPSSWRTYLHPILTSSLATVLVIWAFSATVGVPIDSALQQYRTGNKYIQLWRATSSSTAMPGAGDFMATLLDASIVSLALPCFQHRRELRARFVLLAIPSVIVSVTSLLVYPPLCGGPKAGLGIQPRLSLALVPRSLTLALATPVAENLGAETHATAAIAIVSGIVGVIIGPRLLALIRIPQDDYVTRGITLGINSSAMATAFLLKTDPRAAALSCLSMVLFGTITVILTSIPAISTFIRGMVGL